MSQHDKPLNGIVITREETEAAYAQAKSFDDFVGYYFPHYQSSWPERREFKPWPRNPESLSPEAFRREYFHDPVPEVPNEVNPKRRRSRR